MLNTDGSGLTNLYTFTDEETANGLYDGAYPVSKLVLSGNILFGTTAGDDGSTTYGTVFGIDTGNNNNFTVFWNFSGAEFQDGASPNGDLILSAGTLCGTTSSGGNNNNYGTIFIINCAGIRDPINPNYVWRYPFGEQDGVAPYAGLVQKTISQ
jgi:hypothetical protein